MGTTGTQPAQPPGLLQELEGPPCCPHLDPPYSVLDGCRRGCHLLVHHGSKLLLTHIQTLGLQFLGEEGIQQSDGVHMTPNDPAGSLGKRLGQQGSGAWGWVPCPAPYPTDVPQQRLAHGWCHGCTAHLAQLKDALQGGPHQAGLGLQQSLRILQSPHELQCLRPTLPAGVDQAWGERAVGASA